jgi:hypothetical protein
MLDWPGVTLVSEATSDCDHVVIIIIIHRVSYNCLRSLFQKPFRITSTFSMNCHLHQLGKGRVIQQASLGRAIKCSIH